MKVFRFLSATTALFLVGGYTVASAGAHASGGSAASSEGSGSCQYVMENMFAGPYNACTEPTTHDACDEIGTTDDNRDASHSGGACPTDGLVGTCDLGDSQLRYYEGDVGGLEIGCGFSGGDWITAE